ncbi:MAG: response regulator transcription factor [bacterium]|nr:response regulator transcription factor [bacterium]
MIRLAIADDHQLVRDGLRMFLSKLPHLKIVAEASNGQELLTQMSETEVDVAIIDINMPVMDGKKTMERIRQSFRSTVKIIFLSYNNGLHFVRKYMLLGASAFLGKTSAIPVLIEAIEQVHAGHLYFESHVPEELIIEISTSIEVDYTPILGETLSRREAEVVGLLCQGYSCPQIADCLFISKRTVERHKANIFTKFGVDNFAQMMVKAIIHGYYDLPI